MVLVLFGALVSLFLGGVTALVIYLLIYPVGWYFLFDGTLVWKFLRNIRMSNSRYLEDRLTQCNLSLDDFHSCLTDIVREHYQKPLYELRDEEKSQLTLYELRAVDACLNLHNVPPKYHERYMLNRLMRGGYPEDVATGMVAGYSSIRHQPVYKYHDGEKGYKTWLLMGEESFNEVFMACLISWEE